MNLKGSKKRPKGPMGKRARILRQKCTLFLEIAFFDFESFQSDIGQIISTLQDWCDNCDVMLGCIEKEVTRANNMKEKHVEHKNNIEKQVGEIRDQLKAKQQLIDAPDDPESRMEVDREKREKKGAKVKGLRGSGKTSFWQK